MQAQVIRRSRAAAAAAFLVGLSLGALSLPAGAATTVSPTFADNSVISVAAPAYELDFTAAATETVTISVQDLALAGANPQGLSPLSSINLAVTANGAIANQVTSGSSAVPATLVISPSSPVPGQGTLKLAATANTVYQVRLVGTPNATATAPNSVSVGVSGSATGTKTGTHAFVLPTASPQTAVATTQTLTVTQPGDYTVTFVDDAAPVKLQALVGGLLAPGQTVSTPLVPGTGTLPGLVAGTYQLSLVAVADSTAKAGLFGIKIAPVAGGKALIDSTVPVGAWTKTGGTDLSNPSTQSVTLTATDLVAPANLATLAAAATAGSTLLGTVSGGGAPATFSAPAGIVSLWQLATPASGSAGAFTLTLSSLYPAAGQSGTQSVTDPTSNLFSFVASIPAAGSYVPVLADLQFPNAFTSLSVQIYQGGKLAGQSPALPSIPPVTLQTGDAVLVVKAVPTVPSGATAGDGVFSVSLRPSGATTATFSTTQTVGPDMHSVPFAITTGGNFDIALTDLLWPTSFGGKWGGLVTQDAPTQGTGFPKQILGSATFANAALPAGNYIATLYAAIASGNTAGMYYLALYASAPTVTLSASPSSVTTGTGTRLSWTSTNATGCTASGSGATPANSKFTGAQGTSGAIDEGAYSATGTAVYTMSCTGAAGTGTATATVTITAGGSSSGGSSGGGGGALAVTDLLLVAALARLARARRG